MSVLSTKRCIPQATEVEQLKLKVKQYGDYDEIKRELEIMKVCCLLHAELSLEADIIDLSTSSSLAWKVTTMQKTT